MNASYSIIFIAITPVLTQGYDLQGISQPKLDLSVQELAQPLRMNL